eukprot:symbB.v1.2.032334.t1/scaffold3871.1/size59034/5
MAIAHVKVDDEHMGQGLGGLLIDAAEDYSKSVGWQCRKTYLSVLKANARARRCYSKAGFKFESSSVARWGSKGHAGSEWQRWRKVHKHHFDKHNSVKQPRDQEVPLPLIEVKTKKIAGYVHATYTADKAEMATAHEKVDDEHMGQGLGGLLIDAAEDYSKRITLGVIFSSINQ